MTTSVLKPICQECGMLVKPLEYHPYTACLIFKACHNGETVRVNLKEVMMETRDNTIEYCALVLDAADKNDHPSDLADKLRSLKN